MHYSFQQPLQSSHSLSLIRIHSIINSIPQAIYLFQPIFSPHTMQPYRISMSHNAPLVNHPLLLPPLITIAPIATIIIHY